MQERKMEIAGPEIAVADHALLNELWESVGWDARTRQQWESYLGYVDISYTAISNGAPVGVGMGVKDGADCLITRVCVHPQYQGRHIGTDIVTRLMNTANLRGYRSARLTIPGKNPSVRVFYEKIGFRLIDWPWMEMRFRQHAIVPSEGVGYGI